MRVFDWKPLLTKHGIPFIEKGANVKRGEFNIKCPWCGNADPSYHMGIDPASGWYSCWRNRSAHSGKSPLRLTMKLLNVPYWKAREICGLEEAFIDPEGFDAAAARIMGRTAMVGRPEQVKREFLDLDSRFIEIDGESVRTRRWFNYLYGRGFNAQDIAPLCKQYNLRADRARERLIMPFYLDGKLVTWTGRAIGPANLRYLDLAVEDSLVPAKETLYNHDVIPQGGKVLVVVEGPMDVLKMDFYAQAHGVRAVGLATNSLTDHQTYMLEEAASQFDYIGIMMDNASAMGVVDSMRMRQSLLFLPKTKTLAVPFGRKDAGECRPWEIDDWAYDLTRSKTR